MSRLARVCGRHRWTVVVLWLLGAVALIVAATAAPGPAARDITLPGSESQRAADLLGGRTGEPDGALVVSGAGNGAGEPGRGPGERAAPMPGIGGVPVERLVTRMRAVPGVTVGNFERAPGKAVASAPIRLEDARTAEAVTELKRLRDASGLRAELAGEEFADFTPGGVAEGVGLLAAAVILFVAFGSVIATGLPLLVGVVGVACGVALLSLLGHLVATPDFAVYLTVMLGLGVGVDYALLVVTRFRAALGEGLDVPDAVVRAMATAGRSVLFAGVTVILTGAGILLLGPELGGGMALAVACGVLMVMAAALTLLPALLALVGRGIDRYGLPHRGGRQGGAGTLAHRWSRVVQARPWTMAAVGCAVLAVMTLPAVDLRLGWSDAGNRPVSDTTRRAHDLLAEGFGPGAEAPLVLAGPGAEDLGGQVAATPGVARVEPAGPGLLLAVPSTDPQDEATTGLVHRLRAALPPPVLVTGTTAAGIDFAEFSGGRLPWLVGAVLLASFAVLVPVFRSVVVPLKAVAVNVLSIGATYGAVVAVFQWGWLSELFGLGEPGPVDAWVPLILFVIAFALSMDYEVFLLTRIQEDYQRTRDNSGAVASGLAATARVITAGAAIMVCVFAAFGAFDDRALKIMGIGLATAVLVDATVVRMVLVPSVMELLGERNWWLPRLTPRPRRAVRPAAPPDR